MSGWMNEEGRWSRGQGGVVEGGTDVGGDCESGDEAVGGSRNQRYDPRKKSSVDRWRWNNRGHTGSQNSDDRYGQQGRQILTKVNEMSILF